MRLRSPALALFLLAACGPGDSPGNPTTDGGTTTTDGSTSVAGLKSIVITPANQTLTIPGAPVTSAYQAMGTFSDGTTKDVTAKVTFFLQDPSLGGFSGATFTSGVVGGTTTVVAEAGSVSGSTPLTLILQQTMNDPGSTNLPADPGSKFGGAVAAGRAPDLVYPNDGVLLPPNLGKLELHFRTGGAQNTLFELAFKNMLSDIKVYLRCTTPLNGGCVFTTSAALWRAISQTNRNGKPLTVTLRGTDDAGSAVGVSAGITISFSKDPITGGLYYWTTSGSTAIMRYDFGSTTQVAAEKFVGPEVAGNGCIGCHALSHDGKKIVLEAGTNQLGPDGRVALIDVMTKLPMVTFASTPKSSFESWNMTGSQFVGVYADSGATNFGLKLFDGMTGALVAPIAGTGTASNPATHPDWSADGSKIAYTKVGLKSAAFTNQRFGSGAIEVVTATGATWSAPVEVVPAATGKNHYYPTFAPDGTFLVYDESTCPGGASHIDCNSDSDPSARLFAVAATAGARPIELARANAPGKLDGTTVALTSSYPKWSPFVFRRTGELGSRLEWVTFSSTRAYGLRPAPAPPNGGTGQNPSGTYIWMAAIDPDKIAGGLDPSYPAFALPFQDYATSNHIAQWTTKVIPTIN